MPCIELRERRNCCCWRVVCEGPAKTKFSDAAAIGQSAEGVVAARGDKEDLHSVIRRYYFEFRLERMPSHRVLPPNVPGLSQAFQPRRRFLTESSGPSALQQTIPRFAWRSASLDRQPVENEDQSRPWHFMTVAF
jgi:hypothetical protein